MDLMTGLAAAAQALDITKKLRDLSAELDAATYKAQIAELYSALADVKMALSDAKEAIHERDQKIRKLEADIEASKSGEACPLCGTGRMKITASHAHPVFGERRRQGGQLEQYVLVIHRRPLLRQVRNLVCITGGFEGLLQHGGCDLCLRHDIARDRIGRIALETRRYVEPLGDFG